VATAQYTAAASDARRRTPLPPAVSGQRVELLHAGKPLSVYVDGEGPPLLLVHSVNAAASAAEMRPLHEHFRAKRTVVSLDLPGFGGSDRSDRDYDPRLMTDALHATVTWVHQRCGDMPIDAMALSLGCEFLARAASEAPASFGSLALISPTGFDGRRDRSGPPGSTLAKPWLHALLRGPGWGRALFGLLTRPKVVRYFLRRTYGSKDIDPALWEYAVLTARRPGAEHAPLSFLAGKLFSADIHRVYESLELPVWVAHGVRGDFADYNKLSLVSDRANWQSSVYPTGALVHFEVPDRFCADYDLWQHRQGQLQPQHSATRLGSAALAAAEVGG
jgi:pimeloyl-ACP methyl ester carboxylesterase